MTTFLGANQIPAASSTQVPVIVAAPPAPQEYIASTIPAQSIQASGTNLFQIAMLQTGDPLQWVAIAELNDLIDPWIFVATQILIPPVLPTGTQTGILGL